MGSIAAGAGAERVAAKLWSGGSPRSAGGAPGAVAWSAAIAWGVAAGFASTLAGCVLLPTLSGPPPTLSPAPAIGAPSAGRATRGAFHCHSHFSHDSDGSIAHVAESAREGEVAFVVLTDHTHHGKTPLGPRGEVDGVVFLPGSESKGSGGSVFGIDLAGALPAGPQRGDTQGYVDAIAAVKGLSFLGHAELISDWSATGWDGLEVVNLHAAAMSAPRFGTALTFLFYPPGAFLRRLIRHAPREVMQRWDAYGRERRLPGVGGCDAHENINLLGPLGLPVATYGECFRALATHLLLRFPGPDGIREALAAGRGYVAFEIEGSALGFRFAAFDPDGVVLADLGEEVAARADLTLRAAAPGEAALRLLRDGEVVAEGVGEVSLAAPAPGVYRVEATLGDDPFVWSNPIYVRQP